jgi:hypothetical protein
MRRITVTLALILVAGVWPAAPAVAHGATAAQPRPPGISRRISTTTALTIWQSASRSRALAVALLLAR